MTILTIIPKIPVWICWWIGVVIEENYNSAYEWWNNHRNTKVDIAEFLLPKPTDNVITVEF